MEPLVLPLSSPHASLVRVGGKGANLAELARAGFMVPPGFFIVTDAYRAFVTMNRITAPLLSLVRQVGLDDPRARTGLRLKAIAAARRADYAREQARRQMPRVLLSTGEAFYGGVSGADTHDLLGDPVSPGVVEGRVRVVHEPGEARLEPGEILVCHATDPGWTPLFLTAGGLVMELGGLITHGSVVAREYGIPAVVGVDRVTSRLQTGQRVRVDGSRGQVTLLEG